MKKVTVYLDGLFLLVHPYPQRRLFSLLSLSHSRSYPASGTQIIRNVNRAGPKSNGQVRGKTVSQSTASQGPAGQPPKFPVPSPNHRRRTLRFAMALSLARSPNPAAALPAGVTGRGAASGIETGLYTLQFSRAKTASSAG